MFLVKFHCVSGVGHIASKKHETADECASSAFAMVAVDNTDIVDIFGEMLDHDFADDEQSLEFGCFVVFPVEGVNIR